jgi:hypothetical protein
VSEHERKAAKAELDAYVAKRIFGITRKELADTMDTFGVVRRRDEKAYGEFRTKAMILGAFDQLD